MPTTTKGFCPWCQQPYQRRKKGGLCPTCDRPIYHVNGFAATEERPALSVELLEHFCRLVAIRSKIQIVFPIGSRQHLKELAHAIDIIERCDGDIDLSKEVLTQLFQLKQINWRDRTSLFHCMGPDFYLALGAAKKVIAQQRAEQAALSRSMSRTAVEVPIPAF